jgi:NAD(P)-dependent dehydrogenase (short-subunit alcohol dehydrogenase family)
MKTVPPNGYVLVTGTSRGLGRALVDALRDCGLSVAAVSRHTGPFPGMRKDPPFHRKISADVTDMPSVDRELARLFGEWGAPRMVVHNAGVLRYRGVSWKESDESVRETFDVNILAPVLWVSRTVPGMIAAGRGGQVFLSSTVGREYRTGWGSYALSKWSVEALSANLSRELPDPLYCFTLNPGPIATDMRRMAYPENDPAAPRPPEAAARPMALFFRDLVERGGRSYNGSKLNLDAIEGDKV